MRIVPTFLQRRTGTGTSALLCWLAAAALPLAHTTAGAEPAVINDNKQAPFMGIYSAPPPQAIERTTQWADWLGRKSVWAHASYDPHFTKWEQIGEWTDWNLTPWEPWVKADPSRRVVYSIPIIPKDSGCTLAEGAAGKYNERYLPLARGLVSHGLGNSILRLGWEFNGNWYAWSVKSPEDARNYAEYWRQIVKTIRSVPGTQNLQFCWNGTITHAPFALEDAFPGNEYVDCVGVDVYDESWSGKSYPYPANATPEQRLACQKEAWSGWITPELPAYGIAAWAKVAAAHKKPLCIPEWGLERKELQKGVFNGGLDDPYFIEQMAHYINDPANGVYFASYFNDDASTVLPAAGQSASQYPQAAAKLRALFSLPGSAAAAPANR